MSALGSLEDNWILQTKNYGAVVHKQVGRFISTPQAIRVETNTRVLLHCTLGSNRLLREFRTSRSLARTTWSLAREYPTISMGNSSHKQCPHVAAFPLRQVKVSPLGLPGAHIHLVSALGSES